MKTKFIFIPIQIALGFAFASAARADYNPLALTPGSFNADVIVEASAPKGLDVFTTGTIDGGTNNNGNTFYEQGWDTSLPWTGVPPHGSTFTDLNAAGHQFIMPPDYTTNNCVFVGGAVYPGTSSFVVHKSTGAFTVTTPAAYSSLSVLFSSSGGMPSNVVQAVVNHMDGTAETFNFGTPDWFNGGLLPAYLPGGRVSLDNAQVNSLNSTTTCKLWSTASTSGAGNSDFTLTDTASPVTNIVFNFVSGVGRTFIFGVSGSTDNVNWTPIPVSGFNLNVIIPLGAGPVDSIFGKNNVTMDAGTNNTGNTFYEQGFNKGSPTHGLPPAGSTFTGIANHTFTMPASYAANDCVFLANQVGYQTGTITLTAPAAFQSLSFLGGAGNGPLVANYTVNYADASPPDAGSISIPDWFNAATGFSALGRFVPDTLTFNNEGTTTGSKIYATDITLTHPASPVSSIALTYVSGGRAPVFAVSGSTDGTTFIPVAFTGFDADIVIEAVANPDPFRPPHNAALRTATTVSMDGGTNNTGNTWYEQGWYPLMPFGGLPHPGTIITSLADSTKHYKMPSDYTINDAIYVDYAHTNANLTLVPPYQTYSALSFLTATANNNVTNRAIMQYQDGFMETNIFVGKDWFGNTPFAYVSYGRMSTDSRCINSDDGRNNHTNNFNPRLYEQGFTLGHVGAPLTNINLNFLGAINATSGRIVIFAASATAGAVPPIFSVQPGSINTNEGATVSFQGLATATFPITYQWQAGASGSGVYTNLSNGGQFSGATTANLTITGTTYPGNVADYILIASDAAGSTTSSVATLTLLCNLADVLQPTDPIVAYQPNGGASPAAESVDHAIDGLAQKYLNFGQNTGGGGPYVGPTGFIVTPALGSTIVTCMRLYTANDTVGRDPADYTLEGSNDGGVTWNTISTGSLNLPAGRNGSGAIALNPFTQFIQEVRFPNASGYTIYRWSSLNDKDNTQNSMQIGEVQLLGVQTPTPPIITLQPVPVITNYVGANPTFCVKATGFPANLTYQWYLNGITLIPGATSATYTKPNVQLADSGKAYSCTIMNANGTVTSSSTTLYVIPAPTDPYPVAIMADHPIAWWRLNEGPDNTLGNDGSVANDYFGGNPGVYTNVNLGQPGFSTTDPDTAAQFGVFNAFDSYVGNISCIDFTAPSNTAVNFSVEAWVNGTAQLFDAGIITKGVGGFEQFNLDTGGADPAHNFRFFVRDAQNNTHGSAVGTVAPDGNWHHVVGVCDETHSQVILYIDGISNAAASAVTPFDGVRESTVPINIGARKSTSATNIDDFQFQGVVDEAAIYNYALTPAQVLNHYYAAHYAPVFTLSPTNTSAAEGSTATFFSSAYGAPALTYQWYDVTLGDPGTPLTGQNSADLALPDVTSSMRGNSYRVVACNPYGCVTNPAVPNAAVTLNVVSGPPTFIVDIPPTNFVYGGTAVLYAPQIGGTSPFTYQWQKNGVNLSDGGRITGSHSATLTIANSQLSDAGQYQLQVSNAQGGPVPSVLSTLLVETVPDFNSDGFGWGRNGNPSPATVSGNVLTLTIGAGNTARSAFYQFPVYVGAFRASFTYQNSGPGGADGIAFVLQNDPRGTNALGGGGGALGVSGIIPSAELEFNIYAPNSPGGAVGGSFAYHVNGANAAYVSAAPVAIDSGNPLKVTVTYIGGVLTMNLLDTVTLATFSTSLSANLPAAVGGTTALVGFTGADGGASSIQTISNFTYVPLPTLTVTQPTPTTVQLSWPSGSGNGYVLQCSDTVTGPYIDVDPQPTSPYTVTPSVIAPRAFYRLSLVKDGVDDNVGKAPFTFYDTRMRQLDISGGNLPPGIKIRISPTLPSIGKTAIQPLSGGQFVISSYFDLFTELSMDNGLTWQASTSAPPRMQLVATLPSQNLPPGITLLTNGPAYVSPDQWHALYAAGIEITNASHNSFFTSPPGGIPPPPPGGVTANETFNSSVGLLYKACPTCPYISVETGAIVNVDVTSRP